jgi:hypothetical protein
MTLKEIQENSILLLEEKPLWSDSYKQIRKMKDGSGYIVFSVNGFNSIDYSKVCTTVDEANDVFYDYLR